MKKRLIALVVGISCHVSFLIAIALMAYMLYFGLTKGVMPLAHYGRAVDLILLLQFPLLHSFFLSKKGRQILSSFFPDNLGRDLLPTTFALIASWQLIVVFLFWTPHSSVWFAPTGNVLVAWSCIYAGAWLLLVRSLYESGMAMQTGALGWIDVVRERKIVYPPTPKTGLHGLTRNPIYLSFALILLTGPTWGIDHLMFAAIWTTYCVLGPKLKERRIMARSPDYVSYRESVPYFLPIKVFSKGARRGSLTKTRKM